MTERRRHPRLDTFVLATLRIGEVTHQVACVDISLGGAFLATQLRLRVGRAVDLVLLPPDVTQPQILLRGVVRYVVDGESGRPDGIALEWGTTERDAVARLLEDLLRCGRATSRDLSRPAPLPPGESGHSVTRGA